MKALFNSIIPGLVLIFGLVGCKKESTEANVTAKATDVNIPENVIYQKVLLDQKTIDVPVSFNLEKASY